MEFRNPQFRENLHTLTRMMKLAPVPDEQTEIADELIGENIDRVTAELIRHRTNADRFLAKIAPGLESPETKALFREYPIGCCMYIREAVIGVIQSSALEEKDAPQTQKSILTQIVETLGVKRVWGVQNDQYFQNGIQAGNYFLDAANDTVDITQPKVVVSTIEEARFRDIRSLQDYLDISTKYNKFNFERNTAVPELAPLFPVIEVETGKGMQRKRIHNIPATIIADSLLRNGLAEFEEAYSTTQETDDTTKRRIAASVYSLNYKYGFQQTNPYPSPGSGLSIRRSFSAVSRALSSPEIDPRILYRLEDMVNKINKKALSIALS